MRSKACVFWGYPILEGMTRDGGRLLQAVHTSSIKGHPDDNEESAVIAPHLFLLMASHPQIKQQIRPLLLQAVDLLLVLVPQLVAGGTGLVFPPGLVAPPPPLPVPRVIMQPLPVLHVRRKNLGMGQPQMRVYLLLEETHLLLYDFLQAFSYTCQVLLACGEVFSDVSDGQGGLAAGTSGFKLGSFEDKSLHQSHIIELLPAEGALAMAVTMADPLRDAGQSEDVLAVGLAVDSAGVRHKLETDGAEELFVRLLADQKFEVHANKTHLTVDYYKYAHNSIPIPHYRVTPFNVIRMLA